MFIRPAQHNDAALWERMRQSFWPSAEGEHAVEIAAFFVEKENAAAETLPAFDDANKPLGFIEADRIICFKKDL